MKAFELRFRQSGALTKLTGTIVMVNPGLKNLPSVFRLIEPFDPGISGSANEESFELLINSTIVRIKVRSSNRHLEDALFKVIDKYDWHHCRTNNIAQGTLLLYDERLQEHFHERVFMHLKVVWTKLCQSDGSNISGGLTFSNPL